MEYIRIYCVIGNALLVVLQMVIVCVDVSCFIFLCISLALTKIKFNQLC